MTQVAYRGWTGCHRLANRWLELVAVADVGPRVIHLSNPGGENIFGVLPDELGLSGGDQHRLYGGHRLWHAPEAMPRTYWPDNEPVEAVQEGQTLRLIQPVEKTTGIQKEIVVVLSDDSAHVEVRHSLTNSGPWAMDLAPWSPTIMNTGGTAIVPQSDAPTPHSLLPNRIVVLWPYTSMPDPRVHWGRRYVMIRQMPGHGEFKLGLNATAGWAAYQCGRRLFVKCFRHQPGAAYPDNGCSVEVYACDQFLELETLGGMVRLEPGATVQHTEHWFLFDDVEPVATEDDVDRIILPLLRSASSTTSV
jgi:hypothetical protein